MKKSSSLDGQLMDTLKRLEAELAVPDMCREPGISAATVYEWRAKFGCMYTYRSWSA